MNIDEIYNKCLLTGNYDELNEYYRKNPPPFILDSDSVKHINEIALPGEYELHPCKCGIRHPVESDTWYHKGEILSSFGNRIGIYRACKICGCTLTKKFIK